MDGQNDERQGGCKHRQQELPGTRDSPEVGSVHTCGGISNHVLRFYLHLWPNEQLWGEI